MDVSVYTCINTSLLKLAGSHNVVESMVAASKLWLLYGLSAEAKATWQQSNRTIYLHDDTER